VAKWDFSRKSKLNLKTREQKSLDADHSRTSIIAKIAGAVLLLALVAVLAYELVGNRPTVAPTSRGDVSSN
jgi:hypothetical protein